MRTGEARTTSELERELRTRGMPLMLLPRARRAGLLARTAPAMTALAVAVLAWTVAQDANDEVSAAIERADEIVISTALFTFFLALGVVVTAPLIGLALTAVQRRSRIPDVVWTGLTVVATAVVLAAPLLPRMGRAPALPLRALFVVLVVAVTYAGLGSMLRWAARRVRSELGRVGPMLSRVLPLLMLSFLFLFFNAEIWQVMANLDAARTWGAAAVLGTLGMVLASANIGDSLRHLLTEADATARLRTEERVNVHVVGVLITLVQAAVFATIVFAFFVAFGALTISPETGKAWVGRPVTSLGGLADELNVSWTLVQVSLLLATLAGLSFIASAGTDETYRERFLSPLVHELGEGLALRQSYLAAADQEGEQIERPAGGVLLGGDEGVGEGADGVDLDVDPLPRDDRTDAGRGAGEDDVTR